MNGGTKQKVEAAAHMRQNMKQKKKKKILFKMRHTTTITMRKVQEEKHL